MRRRASVSWDCASIPWFEASRPSSGRRCRRSFPTLFRARFFATFARELKGVEGVRQAVGGLSARVCVASSSAPERLRFALRVTGYETLFAPNIFSAAEVAQGKPSPDLFLFAARAMGATPRDCLVIEDSVAGVAAARAAGMTVFGFVGGSHFSRLDAGSGFDRCRRRTHFRRHGAAARHRRRAVARWRARRERTEAMARKSDHDGLRLDEAARAGWLYYVAGNTQDEIARKLGISRQAAQRLVSLAISERLIKVRLDHPIARCMELAAALKLRYDLRFCEIAPTDPASTSSTLGIAQVAAAEFERWLRRPEPAIIGIGTGRTMRAVADQLPAMECPQHKLVALVGTTKTDGSASFYDVIIRVSDSVRAPHYPMPVPVIARSVEERELLTNLASVKSLFDLVDAPTSVSSASARSAIPRRWCRTALSVARKPRRSATPARSARSPAGPSTRRGKCLSRAQTSGSPRRPCDARTIGL